MWNFTLRVKVHIKIDKILTATDDLTDLFGLKLADVSVDKIRSYCACCITYFGLKLASYDKHCIGHTSSVRNFSA